MNIKYCYHEHQLVIDKGTPIIIINKPWEKTLTWLTHQQIDA